ncbi:MAG: MMPL family transporter [Methylotetracoccus sp.]
MTRRHVLASWLALMLVSGWIVWRSPPMSRDLTYFLPRDPGLVDQILIEQLRSGLPSRLILIALSGADSAGLADASRRLAATLRPRPLFERVDNGQLRSEGAELRLLYEHRYQLSPAVRAGHFDTGALRRSLVERLRELNSSTAGLLTRPTLREDPTGEVLTAAGQLFGHSQPRSMHGVWFSTDGSRALLIARTGAPGFDLDAQADAVRTIRDAFAGLGAGPAIELSLSGPGPFSVEMNETITRDAERVSSLTIAVVSMLLWLVYRSARFVLLTLLPLASGALVGMAAVTLIFGNVHGIMLGFGSALIGFANDYPIHLFTHLSGREPLEVSIRRVWPTIRLGVLATVAGFGAMLFSGFPGLVELGVFSISGLLAAGLVCRWVMPVIISRPIGVPDWTPLVGLLTRFARYGSWRLALALAALIAIGHLRAAGPLWDDDIGHLSPLAEASQRFDQDLRSELGAPDLNHVIVLVASDAEAALASSERLAGRLDELVRTGRLHGYDLAARYLPSAALQRLRQQALPEPSSLRAALSAALVGLPFARGTFEPFVEAVEQARHRQPLTLDDLRDTGLGAIVEPLLFRFGERWVALITLSGVVDAAALAAASAEPGVHFFDLKAESSRLVTRYRQETLAIFALGVLVITLLLRVGLGDWRAVGRVMTPMVLALASTALMMRGDGAGLSLFHLIALLLVMGLAMDYGLFFNRRPDDGEDRMRTHLALVVCTATTVIAFGSLLVSDMPLLRAFGGTVALGAGSAFVFAAWLARPLRVSA